MRLLLDPNAVLGGAVPAQPAPAAPVQNPHPAAVQPAPAGVPNPLTGQPAPVQVIFQGGQNPTPFQTPPQYGQPAAVAPAAPTVAQPLPAAAPPIPGIPADPAATARQMVTLPLEQLQAFTSIQQRLYDMEAGQRAQQEAAQQEQARILAQKGEVENALRLLREQSEQTLNTERQRLAQIEDRAKRYALDGEVSRALAGHNLVPGGAEQLAHLWRSQFIVDTQGDSFSVRTPTFQSVGEFVSQQLARPEYAHFVRASTQGGTATGQTIQAAQTPPANPEPAPQPRNMGEAVIMHMQGLQKAQGDGRVNLSLPMGLRAIR